MVLVTIVFIKAMNRIFKLIKIDGKYLQLEYEFKQKKNND